MTRRGRERRNQASYWSEARWLLVAFVSGLVVRTLMAGFAGGVSHDAAAYYLPNARAIAEGTTGHWQEIAVPFAFPWIVARLQPIVGGYELAALVLSIVSSAAMVFPIYGLCRAYFPGWVSIHRFGMLIAVVHPFSVRYGGDAKADAFYAFVFVLALWAGVSTLLRPRAWTGIAFGALVGVAYLVRPEALGLAGLEVIAAIAVVVHLWRHRAREDARDYTRRVVVAAVLAVLALAPALAVNLIVVHDRIGRWTLSPKAGVLQDYSKGASETLLKLNAAGDQTLQEERLTSTEGYQSFSPVEQLMSDPGEKLRAYGGNLYEYLRVFPPALGSAIAVFWVVGLVLSVGRVERWVWWAVGGLFVFYGLAFAPFYVSRRFWLALVPAALPFSAAGAYFLALHVYRWQRLSLVRPIAILIAVTSLPEGLNSCFDNGLRWFESEPEDLGTQLAEMYPGPRQTVVSSKGLVTWYADWNHLPRPAAELPEVLRYMRLRGARFLVVDAERLRRREAEVWSAIEASDELREIGEAKGKDVELKAYLLVSEGDR